MNFTGFVILWVAFGLVTAGLALYRKFLAMKEEDYIHLSPGGENLIPKQSQLAHRMDLIDRWGESLTVVTVLFGLALAAAYLYQAWTAGFGR
jgi:hypothetical protein